jgi:hypothetical protein
LGWQIKRTIAVDISLPPPTVAAFLLVVIVVVLIVVVLIVVAAVVMAAVAWTVRIVTPHSRLLGNIDYCRRLNSWVSLNRLRLHCVLRKIL